MTEADPDGPDGGGAERRGAADPARVGDGTIDGSDDRAGKEADTSGEGLTGGPTGLPVRIDVEGLA